MCSTQEIRYIDVLATWPIMSSCGYHGVRLVPELDVVLAPINAVPVLAEPVAATALDLAASGVIVARGTLGALLTPEPHQGVYAGDEPSYVALLWREVQRAFDEMIERAPYEPEIAGQLLKLFTMTCHSAEAYDRERDYVIRSGYSRAVPPDGCPDRPVRPDRLGSGLTACGAGLGVGQTWGAPPTQCRRTKRSAS